MFIFVFALDWLTLLGKNGIEREEFDSLDAILREMDEPALNGIFGELTAEEREELYGELFVEVQDMIEWEPASDDSGGYLILLMVALVPVLAAVAVGIFYYDRME